MTEYDTEPTKPWWESVPILRCPVLRLTGGVQGQAAITPEIAQEVSVLNSRIQIVRLAEAGHNVRWEEFAEYVRLVREFLSQ